MIYGMIWALSVLALALVNTVLRLPPVLFGFMSAGVCTVVSKLLGDRILKTEAGKQQEAALKNSRLLIVAITGPTSIVLPFILDALNIEMSGALFPLWMLTVMTTSAILFSYTLPFKSADNTK